MTPLISLNEVGRVYRGGQNVVALQPTDLQVNHGDYLTITGRSGSGKSTLLNIIGLLDTSTSGSYLLEGEDTKNFSSKTLHAARGQLFGFVFQAFHLLAGRSVLNNVELGMLYSGRSRAERRELASEAITEVGLEHRIGSDPRTLSGGEKQRVAIARAIAGRPILLLCDEPTGNLDLANTFNVLSILRHLNNAGMTIAVVTHEKDVAEEGSRRLNVSDGVVSEVTS